MTYVWYKGQWKLAYKFKEARVYTHFIALTSSFGTAIRVIKIKNKDVRLSQSRYGEGNLKGCLESYLSVGARESITEQAKQVLELALKGLEGEANG